MRVAIGSDHAGFELKEAAKAFLQAENCEVLDVGTASLEPVDYSDFAEAVGAALQGHSVERGIILCGSGVGASMAANRIPGVRAGLCHDTYSAHQGVEHDDMNVLVLGGRVVGIELARELIHAFLNARFSGEARHVRRLAKMTTLENPLRALQVFGQSVWLDYIRRSLITSGELTRLIEEDGLCGVTSNPSIFEKAVAGSSDYKQLLEDPGAQTLDAKGLYEWLAVRDIQDAADALAALYQQSGRRDGYVSLEVSPLLAFDTAGTLVEARRLWRAVARDNLMIKVPATGPGIAAIQQLISEGINVNATLLFDRAMYQQVAEAYLLGLERFDSGGGDPSRVASVASFFVSRIDSAFDNLIAQRLALPTTSARDQALLRSLTGRVAIANAKLAYQCYQELFDGPRWQALAARGARPQRLLWASTGTKNPSLSDVAVPRGADRPGHGQHRAARHVRCVPRPRPAPGQPGRGCGRRPRHDGLGRRPGHLDEAGHRPAAGRGRAAVLRIVREAVEGGRPAAPGGRGEADQPADLSPAAAAVHGGGPVTGRLAGAGAGAAAVAARPLVVDRQGRGPVARLAGHHQRATGARPALCPHRRGRQDRRLLAHPAAGHGGIQPGAGGDAADVRPDARLPRAARARFHRSRPGEDGGEQRRPRRARCSSCPASRARRWSRTSSSSTSSIAWSSWWGRRRRAAASSPSPIPHSKMQHVAEGDGFRYVFLGWPNIGGRYSVLSDFGLVPAAAMGVDVARFLDRTEAMVCACMPSVPVEENPGAVLGTILGIGAKQFGRDKLTILASPGVASLGAWLEQLIAESTGKEGLGIIPIDREAPTDVDAYGSDRLFVHLKLQSDGDSSQDELAASLERAGHPVLRVAIEDAYDLGQEFFRWEFATAVAGSILGIHPFDQPDVEASKTATRRLTSAYEERGSLPAETPIFTGTGHQPVHGRGERRRPGPAQLDGPPSLEGYLAAHLGRLGPGDYFALLAYLEMNRANERVLQADARSGAGGQAGRDLPGVRAAVPALDRAGLQGGPEHRRVPADHLRRRRWICPCPGRSTPSGW